MATVLQEVRYDSLEYVQNMKKLGVNEQMAEYNARYTQSFVNKTIKEVIADLHLERFATKDDLANAISALRKDIDKDIIALKYSLLMWIFSISVAGFSTTIGVTYFMMKFMLEAALHIKI